jgi:hypothetical protein
LLPKDKNTEFPGGPHETAEFLAPLIFSTLFAASRGGRPEKIGAIALFAGALISFLVVSPPGLRFRHIETGILMTDMALRGIFLWLSFRCTRFWPIWISWTARGGDPGSSGPDRCSAGPLAGLFGCHSALELADTAHACHRHMASSGKADAKRATRRGEAI